VGNLAQASRSPESRDARSGLVAANARGFDLGDIPNIAPLRARVIFPDVLLLEERRPLGLTAREREVLALVAQGHRNAQVAAALWISPATVGKHLENAYAKLGVTTRTAAVRLVHEHDAGDIAEQQRLA
jgi:DNA-binding CsgD family transcriptional regulator